MKHVIVCGYSRSGTTMFYNMLRNSVLDYNFLDEEASAVDIIGLDKEDYVTKSPLDIFRLDSISRANRFAKKVVLLILIRDIRSILTSFHKAVPDDYFIAYDLQYSPDYEGNLTYRNPGVIPTANAIKKAMDSAEFESIVIKYEELVTDPGAQELKLKNKLGLRLKEQFKNFYRHPIPKKLTRQLNSPRPLDKSRLDAWKDPDHSHRIRSQFTRCPDLFDLLIEYGYEKNNDWFDAYRRQPFLY